MNTDAPHDHLTEDAMVDLINGLAAPEQRRAAVLHMRACDACERTFGERLRAHERLRADGLPEALRSSAHAVRRRGLHRTWAVAAAAVLVVAAVGVWMSARIGMVPDDYWLPVDTTLFKQRSENGQAVDLAPALQRFGRHDAAGAVEDLRSFPAPADDTSASLLRMYLANALVNAGRGTEALPVLQELEVETLPYEWEGPARWLRYLALVQAGERARAAADLAWLQDYPGEVGERARAIRK